MKRFIYVSRPAMSGGSVETEVEELVVRARHRNATMEVTGALMFTGHHFAQVLEGPDAPIDLIMTAILHDPRHHSIQSFEELDVPARLFASWSLAYQGPSTFVDRRIRSLFVSDKAAQARRREELLDLLVDFATPA